MKQILTALLITLSFTGFTQSTAIYDVVLKAGRMIDLETKSKAFRNVGITNNGIVQTKINTYPSLLQLCKELRLLERTRLPNAVPDYRKETIVKIQQTLSTYKARHAKMDTTGWSTGERVDYVLLLAEMNALDYNCRILQPWVRDPAFYAIVWNEQSDTPDHEGPTSFAAIELWNYVFPLSDAAIEDQCQPYLFHQVLYILWKGNTIS